MTGSEPTRLVVLGGGPGGYAAAFYAADLGMQVTLVDREADPGGVCLFRGCIPSKALLHVARLLQEARHAADWGILFPEPRIDLDTLRGWKDSVVSKLTGGLGKLSKGREVQFVQGEGRFTSSRSLEVTLASGARQTLEFDHAIVATGSSPAAIPGWPTSSPRLWDSTRALELPALPGRLLVVGGGYIGLELGSVYAALGSRVTVVEMTDGLLPGCDRDLARVLSRRIETLCEKVMLGTRVAEISDSGSVMQVKLQGADGGPAAQQFDAVLVSVGRRPNTAGFGLENTGAAVGSLGFIDVDGQRRTADPAVFAIGDVAGQPMLAHKASAEARVAVDAIAGKRRVFEPRAIPAVVFTDPEVAWCGLTETEAAQTGQQVSIARFPWQASGRAIAMGLTDGLTKLVLDPESERVLGVGIVGTGAGELIGEGVLAIEMGAVAEDLELAIHAHPTLSETIMEAASAHFGTATHILGKRKR